MKILITGNSGLASGIADNLLQHQVTRVSRSTGHDINHIDHWGHQFLDHDMIMNCAYDGFGQVAVLEFFYRNWKNDPAKSIINIGSRVIVYPRSEIEKDGQYWPYRLHKQTLEQAWKQMLCCQCDIKLINPGSIDTHMMQHITGIKKFHVRDLGARIVAAAFDPTIKRLDLWL